MDSDIPCDSCGGESVERRIGSRVYHECDNCNTGRRVVQFESICPPLYQKTDESMLPKLQLSKAMQWTYGPKGLLLTGPTGLGKTRVAWMLIRRLLVKDRAERGFKWFDCVGFGHEIAEHYKLEDAEQWLSSLSSVPILFFDDFGKLKITERAESELFGVIERRCSKMLPIIMTTNDDGATLASRMTDNRASATIRRLREFCEIIAF